MRMYDVIMKKRNGEALTDREIAYFIEGYTKGEIPDYQVSALMMAIYFQGMDEHETAVLTQEMASSGVIFLISIAIISIFPSSTLSCLIFIIDNFLNCLKFIFHSPNLLYLKL